MNVMTILKKRVKTFAREYSELIEFAKAMNFIVNLGFQGEKKIVIESEQRAKSIGLFKKFDLKGFRIVYLEEVRKNEGKLVIHDIA